MLYNLRIHFLHFRFGLRHALSQQEPREVTPYQTIYSLDFSLNARPHKRQRFNHHRVEIKVVEITITNDREQKLTTCE